MDIIALGEYRFALYDNVRYRASASDTLEPGAWAFGLAAFGTLGGLILRRRQAA